MVGWFLCCYCCFKVQCFFLGFPPIHKPKRISLQVNMSRFLSCYFCLLVDWLICTWFVHISMSMPNQFSVLVVTKGLLIGLKLDCACITKKKYKKTKNLYLARSQSVISTGYKLYFYQFWLMWSCCTRKKPEWTKVTTTWTRGLVLTITRFE